MYSVARRASAFAMAGALSILSAVPALADEAQTSFCAKLSSEADPVCVPAEQGPVAAWEQAAAGWKPGTGATPVIALWAVPNVSAVELAAKKNAKADFFRAVGVAMAFAKTKDRESYAASLRRQIQVEEQFKARVEDLLKEH